MTTKAKMIELANEYEGKADKEVENAAALVVIFGGSDPVAVAAVDHVASLREQAYQWRRLANMHPKTRAVELKKWAGM